MNTLTTLKQNILKASILVLISISCLVSNASDFTVKPVAFTAVINNANMNKVDLKWSTETETNLSHFIVERSIDGVNFSNAALVFAYGNTTSRSEYVFADNINKIKSGNIHYRITSVDSDGRGQVSEIIIIHTDNIKQ